MYTLFAGVVALVIATLAVLLPNLRLLFLLVTDPTVSAYDKFIFPVRMLEAWTTNFTVLSASYTIAIALLAGINVALIVYYARHQKERLSQAGVAAGTLGILSGVVGMGCALCGSLILTSALGTVVGASVVAALPWRGGEFGIIGVFLLGVAMYLLAKQIATPLACEMGSALHHGAD